VLRGTVTYPDERPVAGGRLIVSGPWPGTLEVNTAPDGAFEIPELPADAHAVRVVLLSAARCLP
jgi:hypothetical protein